MSKIDYYRSVLLGVVIGMSTLTVFYIVFAPYNSQEVQEVQEQSNPKGNFTVIDTYKGCDVVQWQYSMLADYKYFLHCASSQGGTQPPQMP
jgi:hypothetical protein